MSKMKIYGAVMLTLPPSQPKKTIKKTDALRIPEIHYFPKIFSRVNIPPLRRQHQHDL